MESRIPVEILGLLRWVARDNDLVISSIACLVGRGGGCGVVRFLAEDGSRNLGLEFLKQLGGSKERPVRTGVSLHQYFRIEPAFFNRMSLHCSLFQIEIEENPSEVD